MSKVRWTLLAMSWIGCLAPSASSDSTLDRPRVIAVLAEPAEATPGEAVRLRAVVVTSEGPREATLQWSFCTTVRAPNENTSASATCVRNTERPIVDSPSEISTRIPSDACSVFGSETPSGRAPIRSDQTGGYYQPLRIALETGEVAIFRQRVRCALPSAPVAIARDFALRYEPNRPPRIAAIRAFADGTEVDLQALPDSRELTLRVEASEDAEESYLFYDARSGALETQREQLSTSWFVSAGAFEAETRVLSGHATDNRWFSAAAETVWLWIVLRDDRGASTVEARMLRQDGSPSDDSRP